MGITNGSPKEAQVLDVESERWGGFVRTNDSTTLLVPMGSFDLMGHC